MATTIRGVLAFALGALSFAVMTLGWAGCHGGGAVSSAEWAAGGESGNSAKAAMDAHSQSANWLAVDGPSAAAAARSLALSAAEQMVQEGMAETRAKHLSADLQIVLASAFTPDFDAYNRLMTSKGARLDKIADGFVQAMLDWKIYAEGTPDLAPTRPIDRRVRFMWNHPAERGMQWKTVRPSSLEVGFGLVAEANTPEWPYSGHYAQLSLYAPQSGRLTEADGKRLNKTKDAAWVMFEGQFASGMQTRMKINFYYDADALTWFPVTVVIGPDKNHRPFPMQ